MVRQALGQFPFLFGGAFIEAALESLPVEVAAAFPFLFGGAFIEAQSLAPVVDVLAKISLPFRRGFH